MFDQYIRFAARVGPHLTAASNGTEHVSFAKLDLQTDQVTVQLSAHGDLTGAASLVAIAVRDRYRHVLVALACARLGVASVSLFPGMTASLSRLVGATLIVSDVAFEGAGDTDVLIADGDWFDRAGSADVASVPDVTVDPAALGRIQLSSGSTGMPKAVEMSWATFDRRLGILGHGDTTRRMLSLIGPESGGLALMLMTWKNRGCVLFGADTVAKLAANLPVLMPTRMIISPVQLAGLLDELPLDAVPLNDLVIGVAGGKVSRVLADRAAIRLGGRVSVAYASSEAGTTAMGHTSALPSDSAVGFVTPSSRVEIVDDGDRRLPVGKSGRIRVTGLGIASGYRHEGLSEPFPGGWFYPGDLGMVDAQGVLHVLGREDEVMNFGGEKFMPEALEVQVKTVKGVADVAAFALEDGLGNAQPWLAIVRSGDVEDAAIGRALTVYGLPPVRVAWIDAIPRTMMGKVRRDELRKAAKALGD